MANKGRESFTVESQEFRAIQLENVYERLSGGKVVGGFGDKGKDIIVENTPGVAMFQVKNSWVFAREFLKETTRKLLNKEKMEFIPIVVGDPGQHTWEEISKSLIEYGGWIGDDVDDMEGNRQKVLDGIKDIRNKVEMMSRSTSRK